jgi:O-antigen biosynthesis protein WbqP
MKRAFDVSLAAGMLILLSPLLLALALLVRFTSTGPALYWSNRVGKDNAIFSMPKFRSMRVDTPQVATHLLDSAASYLSPPGALLRKTSLDELPQLWSILRGDLSFVGPRPALFNQNDLIALRTRYGIEKLTPGLTGWAQINGRDDLSIPAKVAFDREYLERRSFAFDCKIMIETFSKALLRRDGVHH